MEEPYQSSSVLTFTSLASATNRDSLGVASTSSFHSQVREEEAEDQHYQPQQLVQQQTTSSYHAHFPTTDEEASAFIRDDTWSCIVVVLTFWFFVSLTLILGVYGSVSLRLGPNGSFLIQPNPWFVKYIKVEELDEAKSAPMLYGLYKTPSLDVVTAWSETHNASLPSGSHKEWLYTLNGGSQINISYNVSSPSSYPLVLIIAKGSEGFTQWLEDPSYPNTTLSWNIIRGSGMIQQDISKSSNYYVAVGNLKLEEAEVHLNIRLKALLYNATEAYYTCSLAQGSCKLNVFFPNGNAALLTSPHPEEGTSSNEWYVKLSYGPQWVTYIIGIGGMTVLVLLAFHFLNNFHCNHEDRARYQSGGMQSARAPLLSYKDDDLSSWGSSYDSLSQEDEDPEDGLAVSSLEGKPPKDGEYNNNIRRLCAICFDAPRDSFFLPCGHCVACFACGTRIAELAGTCPICQRNMKKVRKIFTV